MNGNLVSLPLGDIRTCDGCGQRCVRVSFQEQRFIYGSGAEAIELAARVPVWRCQHCGHGYTDGDAEDYRHEAVCRHLRVLSPSEIRNIRKFHKLSQAEFARITGFGPASLKRWETGALIQNQSADRLLRLLAGDPEIMRRLFALETRTTSVSAEAIFRTEISDKSRAEAKVFTLRPTGT
jgi:putative zinc finger/helix-turn-helix YgiT family protein